MDIYQAFAATLEFFSLYRRISIPKVPHNNLHTRLLKCTLQMAMFVCQNIYNLWKKFEANQMNE